MVNVEATAEDTAEDEGIAEGDLLGRGYLIRLILGCRRGRTTVRGFVGEGEDGVDSTARVRSQGVLREEKGDDIGSLRLSICETCGVFGCSGRMSEVM